MRDRRKFFELLRSPIVASEPGLCIDDIFSPPSFDEKIYYDDCIPPIYDDYIDESGFEEVVTLFSDESTVGECSISKQILRSCKVYLWRDQQRVERGVHLHTLVDR